MHVILYNTNLHFKQRHWVILYFIHLGPVHLVMFVVINKWLINVKASAFTFFLPALKLFILMCRHFERSREIYLKPFSLFAWKNYEFQVKVKPYMLLQCKQITYPIVCPIHIPGFLKKNRKNRQYIQQQTIPKIHSIH